MPHIRTTRLTLVVFFLFSMSSSCREAQRGTLGPGDDFPSQNVTLEVSDEAIAYIPSLEGPLRILSATPFGMMLGMTENQSIAVTFSRPMIPLGEALPVSPDLLTVQPVIQGTLQWEGSQTLVLIPENPLPPSTAFEVTLSAGLSALNGEQMVEPYVWRFETPRPQLIDTEPDTGERYFDPEGSIFLTFNQRVTPGDLTSYIQLIAAENGRSQIPVSLLASGDSTILITPEQALLSGTSYVVQLRAGLPGVEGHLGMVDETSFQFSTYGPSQLLSARQPRYWWEDDKPEIDPEKGITLEFSTPVRFGDLRQALSFTPAAELPVGIEARDDVVAVSHSIPPIWEPETRYTVTVRNLTDLFGQVLTEGNASFRTGAFKPSLHMASGVMVVEADMQATLPIKATNVEAIQIGMRRLEKDQIIPHLFVHDWEHYYGPREEQESDPEPVPATVTYDLGLERNKPTITTIRLDSLMRGGTGIVAVRLLGPNLPDQGEPEFRAIAQVTRLGITGKFSAFQNQFLVTDLQTASPVTGVAVSVRDDENIERWTGTTDENGQVQSPGWAGLGIPLRDEWSQPVQFALVEKDGDIAFTSSVYQDGLEPYRFNVNYSWWPVAKTGTGSVFSDRGLYRGQETVHIKGILRQKTDGEWTPITDSIRVLVSSPQEEYVFDRRFLPGELGTFHFDWTAPASSSLGVYSVRVVHANDTTAAQRSIWERGDIARGTFRIDAFRAATFEVNALSASEQYVAGDFFEGSISGRYLFGASMAGQPVRYSLYRSPGHYSPPGYDRFRFGVPAYGYTNTAGLYQSIAQAESVLDAEGSVQRRVQLPGNEQGSPATLAWSGTVTDPSRQEIFARTEVTLHPGLFYIGLRPGTTFIDLSRDRSITVDVVTVDPNGVPVSDQAVRVELVRRQWNSVREVGVDGRLRWRSEMTEERIGQNQIVTEPGQAKRLEMPVSSGGSYVIRASGRDVRGNWIKTEAYFYATGSGYVAWERSDDDHIELIPERTDYRPGETASLMVQSPFEEATALITIEREGILSSRVEVLTGSAPKIEVPLTEAHIPNVFVSVILLHGRSAEPDATGDIGAPAFKIGYASLNVDPGSRHLRVEVIPRQETYRPGEEVDVDLRLIGADGRGVPGEIAFSAADAGVLNMIGYTLPDPFDAFYGPRQLGVTTTETRSNIVEQRNFGQKEEEMAGGGGDPDFLLRKDFRALAHWDPAIRTNASGEATVTFRLPENLTTFRLMATALTAGNKFGAGNKDIIVTQPLVLQPALPRFARLEDRFEAGVLISNLTGEAGEASVIARASGLDLNTIDAKTVFLNDGDTREVRFDWSVSQVGDASLSFEAVLGQEKDGFEIILPVFLPTTKVATSTFSSTDDSAAEALNLPDDRVPGLGHFVARLSSTALVGLEGAARYLFEYPYGCIEQKTSRIRPLLVATELLDAFDLNALDGDRQEVIETWMQELKDYWTGRGFSMWPGGQYYNPYTTAYVVLALAEAKDAGFVIPADITIESVESLAHQVRNRSEMPSYYSRNVWADTRALMLYALARHGQILEGEISTLADVFAGNTVSLSVDGESMLLRTISLANRTGLNRFRQPLIDAIRRRLQVEAATAYLTVPTSNDYGWIFASTNRATAFGLSALIEAEPTDDTQQLAQRMVRYLMQARQGGHWTSTQENAAIIDAFRAYYQAYESVEPDFAGEVIVAGQQILSRQFSGRTLTVAETDIQPDGLPGSMNPRSIEIKKSGEGTLYYSLLLETFTTAPQDPVSHGLSVERRLQRLDDRGQPVGESVNTGDWTVTLAAGEMVRVTLRLSSLSDRNYVVVDDALPAGLETVNVAFATSDQDVLQNAGAGQDRWWGSFNHTELRDDRVLLFADYLRRGEHSYTYVARATTPGTFVHPPAQAELMYQPEINGRTATGTLIVQSPGSTTAMH